MEINSLVSQLNNLRNHLKTIELPKDATKGFEKSFDKITHDIAQFEIIASRGINSLADTKNLEKAWQQVTKDLDNIGASLNGLEFSKIFPKEVISNIKQAETALDKYLDKLNEAKKSQEYTSKAFARDASLNKQKNIQESLNKATQDQIKKESTLIAKRSQWTDQIKKDYEDQQAEIAKTTKQLQDQVEVIKQLEARKRELTNEGYINSSGQLSATKRKAISSIEDPAEQAMAQQKIIEAESVVTRLSQARSAKKDYEGAAKGAKEAGKALQELRKSIDTAEAEYQSISKEVTSFTNQLELAKQETNKLDSELETIATNQAKQEWEELVKVIKTFSDVDLSNTSHDIKEVQEALEAYRNKEFEKLPQIVENLKNKFSQTAPAVEKVEGALHKTNDEMRELTRAEQEIENLKNQVLQFFSITNAIQLFKRTVQSALDTVKELDAVMTETAVVTDFTVGDMWEKLPQYSKEASALGASIRDLYSATTLYYQQGLQTEAAMGVGIETMKMARIANMEAADATTAMTAALRGFNMEVNEMNAQRVNDVYSELAAITAADTSQIATAMSKTASIAASANMEFETTSALLAQIIETTQEAPETAGTAMKTIIARFTEVKELFSEGMLTGEDEEGEEININKIDAALKTVGISLKDFLNGSKGIDDIFLELASKWDTLDLATQRYIATTAAGSRQQSRFIAMMSNYGRTMELVNAANNSAGASQEQFDKTLESMEAKLQKLKNAWDQFAMGLANNEILKGAVDVLTGLLNVVNKLTEGLSGGNGLAKSIISLMTVIGALKGGGALLNKGMGVIGESLGIKTKEFDKKKQSMTGKSSINQSYAQGKKDGEAYVSGWDRALGQGKKDGLKAGLKGFFGEETELQLKGNLDNLDANAFSKELGKLELGLSNTDLSQRAMDIRALNEQLADGQITTQQAAEKYQAMGYSLESLGTQTKQFTFDLQSVGQATMVVGGAVGLLSNLFKQLDWEGAAKATELIGAGIMFLGTAIQAVSLIAPKGFLSISNGLLMIKTSADAAAVSMKVFLAETIGPALVAIGPVLALVAAFAALAAVAYFNSPEQVFKRASEAANDTAEAVDAAAQAYDNLKSSLDSIEGKESILNDLTVGTHEWKEAITDLNNEILNLMALYPELSNFVTSDEGVLSISKEGREKLLEKQLQKKMDTQAANAAAQITKQEAQQTVDFNELDNRLIQTKWVDIKDEEGRIVDKQEIMDIEGTKQLAKDLASGLIDGDDARLDFLDEVEGGYEEFLEFGRSLNASEQAIGVFTDSLLNTAAVNAEVSDEFKNQINNIYDTNDITRMIEKEEQETYKNINKSDKENYAALMGYTHKRGNKYEDANGNIITVSKDQVRSQLAAIEAQNKVTGYLEATAKALANVSKEYQKSTKGLVSGQLTKKDLEKIGITKDITSEDKTNIEQKVGEYLEKAFNLTYENKEEKAVSLGFEDYADMLAHYTQKVAEAMQINESIYGKFNNLDGGKESIQTQKAQEFVRAIENVNGAMDLTAQQTDSLVDGLYKVILAGGDVNNFTSYLTKALTGIDSENMETAISYLATTDWTNANDIESTVKALKNLGAQIDESLTRDILKATNAIKTFDLDKFSTKLESLDSIRNKVSDNIENKEATYSKEDMDAFIELGLDTSDFFKTGFDEYTFIGNQEELLSSIDSKVGSILGEMTGDVNEAVSKGEGLENWFEEDNLNWQNGDTTKQIIDKLIGGAYTIGEKADTNVVSVDTARDLLTEMYSATGITPELDVSSMGAEAVKDAMEMLMSYLTNLEQNKQIQAQNNQDNLQQQYYEKSGSELLNIIDTSADAEQIDLATQTLAAQAAQAGVTANEIEYYKKQLKESGKESEHLEEAAMELATRIKTQQTKINEASAAIGEYLEIMDDAAIGSETYISALSGIPEQIKKAFGYEPSMDWVKDNLDLIKEWAAGSEEAGAKIWDDFYGVLVEAMNLSEAQVGQSVSTMIDYLNSFSGLSVWANAFLDNSGFMNAIATSEAEANRFAAYLQGLGYASTVELSGYSLQPLPGITGGGTTDSQYMRIPQYTVKWKPTGASNPWGGTYNAPKSYTPKSGGGGGGGGGGSEPTKWENPYDEFYNTVEKLNEELRTREKLERRYQKLLDNTNTKASDLVKNAREQLDSLQFELKTRQELLAGRERQMADIEREYNDLSSYASYNEEKQVIEIDWTKIEALDGSTNEELTSRIEEYIGKLEEQQDLIEEEQDSIAEIEDAVKEIREQGKDEYFDLESQIKEALEKARQEEIDKLSAINDSINDTNSRLIDAMQSSIDKYRQDRENEKTEEELSDKQRRLAYLQQDTSGANALEILKLQEEIAQGQEDYTDTLIDQKISELQEQNDEAAEQRQQQIDLMQAQLDHYLDSELVWADIYSLMNSGIGPDGIIAGSALEKLLMEGASFEAMSYLEKMKWLEELENNVAKAVQWLMEGNSTEALMAIGDLNKGQKIEFTTADGEKVSGTLDEAGNVITDSGEKYEGVYRTYNGAFVTQENYIKPEPPKPVEPEPESEQPAFTPPQLTDDIKRGVSAAIINGNYGWGVGGARSARLAEVFGTNDIQRNYVNRWITSGYSGSLSDYSYINMRKKFKQYKTGGLADFTGPAWLDGTKSKPEYILNAEQTKSFFQLVDVLGSLKSGATQSSQITGDSIYDVDINVESIGNDYDVEQLASTIKRMINDDARYRNNNAINLQR